MRARYQEKIISLQHFAETGDAAGAAETAQNTESVPATAADAQSMAPGQSGAEDAAKNDGHAAAERPGAAQNAAGTDETPAEEKAAETPTPMGRLLYAMKLQLQQRQARASADEVLRGWRQEAEALREIYPDFTLEAALRENGALGQLLKAGVSLRLAYEATHLEEIVGTAMRYAAAKAGQRTAGVLRAQRERPQENPVQQRAATSQNVDVNSLTGSDILQILGEVSRGAKITFK